MPEKTKKIVAKTSGAAASSSINPVDRTVPKTTEQTARPGDAEKVKTFMEALDHPLKAEIEAVRSIIKNASSKLSERVKWNAPSYFYKEDLVTFNPRNLSQVHLVFHHVAIVKIKSALLEGDYKDRRMTYFPDMKSVKKNKKELEHIMTKLVKEIDKR